MRKIIVVHQVRGSTIHEAFTCEYDKPGDYSITCTGASVGLEMRQGWDAAGRRVLSKTFLHAWNVAVYEDEEALSAAHLL
jgi:hypothetical protein